MSKIELSNPEFTFLNSIDTVQRSFNYYCDQLKTEFLQIIAIREGGFKSTDELEVTVDLKSEDHILTVKKLDR
jgi:hypothetical protein